MASSNIYESRRLLDEYLLFHYGSAAEVLPWQEGPHEALNFAKRTVHDLLDTAALPPAARVLDLGCAVGRSSFELSLFAHEVVGIDYSHRFVDAANALRLGQGLQYERLDEGRATTMLEAVLPEGARTEVVSFEQGDAMDLRADLGEFDVVHAANLLCRLTHPVRLLERLPGLVKPGGQLLLTTPCTWLEEFTPPENWPSATTLEWLKERLSAEFTLVLEQNMPFLIREHARKYQWSVALGMRWLRKA